MSDKIKQLWREEIRPCERQAVRRQQDFMWKRLSIWNLQEEKLLADGLQPKSFLLLVVMATY